MHMAMVKYDFKCVICNTTPRSDIKALYKVMSGSFELWSCKYNSSKIKDMAYTWNIRYLTFYFYMWPFHVIFQKRIIFLMTKKVNLMFEYSDSAHYDHVMHLKLNNRCSIATKIVIFIQTWFGISTLFTSRR